MASGPYDLAVIGGGINGAGIARDASGRGARVLLIERGDLGGGTSSASTKLIHGGLRYLEHYEFGLVRESLPERERIWGIAPHIVWPLRFVLPHSPGMRPRWLLRLGLFLYDHIGGRRRLPATSSIDLTRHQAGVPLKRGYAQGFEYSDCWVDDARLVVLNARDAADRGADVRVRTEVTRLAREGSLWRIEAGADVFMARAVVNAAGPAVIELLERAHEQGSQAIRLVRGSHIVVPRLFDHGYAYFFQIADGRIFFAIPYEHDFTLIGTTDADHHGPLTHVTPSPEEIAYLCDAANGYFARAITPDEVVWSYAGVRPLVDEAGGKPEAATRGYRLELDGEEGEAPLLSVFGGKITTYRHLAEAAVERLTPHLPMLAGSVWTAGAPLPGGDFAIDGIETLKAGLAADYPFLDERSIDRISRAYGTDARRWLGDAKRASDLGEHFGAGLFAAEVEWLVTREWARTVEDILWRRTKLGLRMSAEGVATLDRWLASRET